MTRRRTGVCTLPSDAQRNYEAARERLIQRLKCMSTANREWSPTPSKKRITEIAQRLDDLVKVLEGHGTAQTDIESEHDREPDPEIGPDGYPVWRDRSSASYKGTIGHMRDLAESARRAAAALPDPRAKPMLPFAAEVFLHLRYRHGFPRPTLYEAGDDVRELEQICASAGVVVSSTRIRNALSTALQTFDPHFCPFYVGELL